MHHVLRSDAVRLAPAYPEHSAGFSRCSLVDRSCGSVHTALGLCAIEAGGRIDTHVHSFEESFYVLEGEPVLVLDGHAYPLAPGACGVVPLGVSHAWLGPEQGRAKWLDMLVPQPRGPDEPADTFFLGPPERGEIKDLE